MSHVERRPRAAAIVGVAGTSLGAAERRLFEQKQPSGFILFARNCRSPEQVGALVEALRSTVADPDAPVLIDQEGRRVSRLKPPHWLLICAPRRIGELAELDVEEARKAAWLHARLIA
ncbi:MAG: beta-hexosaminidase, partial [Geminicoccaceae bacterium]